MDWNQNFSVGDEVAGKTRVKRGKEMNLSRNANTEGPNPNRLCTSAERLADIESRIFGYIVADNKII